MIRLSYTRTLGVIAVLVLLFAGRETQAGAEEYLIREGKAQAQIVVSDQAVRMIQVAAEQLQSLLTAMTGAELPIVTTPQGGGVKVYVGRSRWTDELGIRADDLKHGAYRIQSGKDWLALVGRDIPFFQQRGPEATELLRLAALKTDDKRRQELWDRWCKLSGGEWGLPYSQIWKVYCRELDVWSLDEHGTFNAVAAFLHGQGMRWYFPGPLGQVIPRKTSVALPKVNQTVQPDFAVRFANQRSFGRRDEALWELWMGFNRAADILDADFPQHGICLVTGTRSAGTGGSAGIPPKPEDYYALYGQRRDVGEKQCLSSPGLLDENVRYCRARFDILESPMVSVMPADGYTSICQCELCKGKATPDLGYLGLLSNYAWDYVNRVAAEVYRTHPSGWVLGTSYGTYRVPPTNITQFSSNVVVCICQHRTHFDQDSAEAATYRSFRQPFLDKLPKGRKQLLIYEYYRDTLHHQPAFSPHAIAADLKSLKGISLGDMIDVHRVAPTRQKQSQNPLASMAVQHLNLYVTGRCWWDADLDVDPLLEEYYANYYGPARAEMKALVQWAEANWMSVLKSKEKIDQTLALLGAAQAKVEPESVYGQRIGLLAAYLEPLRNLRDQLDFKRNEDLPELQVSERQAKDIRVDGLLDDPFWVKIPLRSAGSLKDVKTGAAPRFKTRFKAAWAGDSMYLGIQCTEAGKEQVWNAATERDQMSIWEGDCVEVLLETQSHRYYQIAVSPAGAVVDLDRKASKADWLKWSSDVEVATRVDDKCWNVEIRIPAAGVEQEELLPLQGVAGKRPSENYPWYINVCRQRLHDKDAEYSAYSPSGKGFHCPEAFAKMYVGMKKGPPKRDRPVK